jgi:phosphate-selective porin OprO/OprP
LRSPGRAQLAALCLVAAEVLATGARAEEELPPEAEVAKPRFFFDVGWDDGPSYELGQRFPALEQFEWAEVAREVHVKGRVGGSLYLDGGALAGGALPDGPRFEIRRARLYTRGDAHLLVPTEYKLEFAFEDQEFFLNDFYLRWRPRRFVDSIRLGYFDPPVSLAALTGSADRSLMEIGAPVSAFAPGYRLGVEVAGSRPQPSLNWTLNLSSLGQSQPNAEATSASALRMVGRAVWRPIFEAGELEEDEPAQLLHLGTSVSGVVSGSGELQYRARPENFLTPYLVDTDEFDGDAILLGVEAAFRRGPFTAYSEYLRSFVEADEGGSLHFQGAYLQLSWILTGETRPYDPAVGVFGRIKPAEEYKPLKGRWGAFELATRATWLDLDDGPIAGGRMATFSIGPAWTWNRWVRFLADYVYAHVDESPSRSNAHIVQGRIELRM